MKIKRLVIVCLLIILCVMRLTSVPVLADGNELRIYLEVLDEINHELGTSYKFPTAEMLEKQGKNYYDLVAFYAAMSIDEFREYVYNAHENAKNADNRIAEAQINMEETRVQQRAYHKTQRYYYDPNNSNYVSISAILLTADGEERYSSITGWNYLGAEYPYYQPHAMTYTYYEGNTWVYCVYSCYKVVGANLISDSNYTLSVYFRGAYGDVYAAGQED